MLQALGKFTVNWNRRGSVYYAYWFSQSSDYFKCVKSLQGIEVVTHNKDDYGVVTGGEYIPFTEPGTLDKNTQDKLLELPRRFFISQFLAHETERLHKKIYQEPKFQRMYTYPGEKFLSSETKKN